MWLFLRHLAKAMNQETTDRAEATFKSRGHIQHDFVQGSV